MSYNRNKTIEYAEKHYYDGNPDYVNFDTQQGNNYTDCANFASQCIHAGGISTNETWHPYTTAWKGANSLRRFIKKQARSDADASQLFPGDLVFRLEAKSTTKPTKSKREARHVAIVRDIQGDTILVYQHGTKKHKSANYDAYAKGVWKAKNADTLFYHIVDEGNNPPNPPSKWQERYGTATLKIGSSGEYVRNMQIDLNSLGYNADKADGKFGNGTANAVKAFQGANGLVKDGLFGKNSKMKLYELVYGANTFMKKEAHNEESEEKAKQSIEERLIELEEKISELEARIYANSIRNN